MLLDALLPKQTHYKPDTKECTFVDFDPTISANVIILQSPSRPTNAGRWKDKGRPSPALLHVAAMMQRAFRWAAMTAQPSSEESRHVYREK
ncbi:MAG: hypothetical protein MPW13_02805 [Candidatus Manganitrophus sp.]|nr:hypothetical protein [Candidatus Manganitrophus sp.]